MTREGLYEFLARWSNPERLAGGPRSHPNELVGSGTMSTLYAPGWPEFTAFT